MTLTETLLVISSRDCLICFLISGVHLHQQQPQRQKALLATAPCHQVREVNMPPFNSKLKYNCRRVGRRISNDNSLACQLHAAVVI